jgi:hypothetical protein
MFPVTYYGILVQKIVRSLSETRKKYTAYILSYCNIRNFYRYS